MKLDEKEVTEVLNDHFFNITQTLGMLLDNKDSLVHCQIRSPYEEIVKEFHSHPSIVKIKASLPCVHAFSFKKIITAEMIAKL